MDFILDGVGINQGESTTLYYYNMTPPIITNPNKPR